MIKNNGFGEGVGSPRPCCWDSKVIQSFWKRTWLFLPRLNTELLHSPTVNFCNLSGELHSTVRYCAAREYMAVCSSIQYPSEAVTNLCALSIKKSLKSSFSKNVNSCCLQVFDSVKFLPAIFWSEQRLFMNTPVSKGHRDILPCCTRLILLGHQPVPKSCQRLTIVMDAQP